MPVFKPTSAGPRPSKTAHRAPQPGAPAPQPEALGQGLTSWALDLQGRCGNAAVSQMLSQASQADSAEPQPASPPAAGPQAAPLPAPLRAGAEQLSGLPLGGVRVHYDSPEPGHIEALAYASGSTIHLAPGQDAHLPHETWHVVQQLQGRVRPTGQVSGRAVNRSPALEREADQMGARAAAIPHPTWGPPAAPSLPPAPAPAPVIQGMFEDVTQDNKRAVKGKEEGQTRDVFVVSAKKGVERKKGAPINLYLTDTDELCWIARADDVPGALLSPVATTERAFFKQFKRTEDQEDKPFLDDGAAVDAKRRKAGGGGVRVVSAKDSTFHVEGLNPRGKGNAQLLRGYLEARQDYAKAPVDPSAFNARIDYGPDVPKLFSDLESMEHPVNPPQELPDALKKRRQDPGNVVRGPVSRAILDEVRGQRKTDGNPTQTAVALWMETGGALDPLIQQASGSPNLYAIALGLDPLVDGKGWEWLHLRAYSMGGASHGTSQLPDNLVLGTWHANSAHLVIESAFKEILDRNREVDMRLEATPTMVEDTHLATEIVYTLTASGERRLSFRIDTLGRTTPTSHDQQYWQAIMAAALLSYDGAKRTLRGLQKPEDASLESAQGSERSQSASHYFAGSEEPGIFTQGGLRTDPSHFAARSRTLRPVKSKKRKANTYSGPAGDGTGSVDDSDSEVSTGVVWTRQQADQEMTQSSRSRFRGDLKASGQVGQVYTLSNGDRVVLTERLGSGKYRFEDGATLPQEAQRLTKRGRAFLRQLKRQRRQDTGSSGDDDSSEESSSL